MSSTTSGRCARRSKPTPATPAPSRPSGASATPSSSLAPPPPPNPVPTASPVRTEARGYVTAIARGEYERAYLIARETNPFASTCGWVCGAPCEAACRRGKIDAPIAIRALKRFVNDRYGVYLGETGESRQAPAWPAYVGPTSTGEFETRPHDLGNTTFP